MPDNQPKLRIVDNPAIQAIYANRFISATVDRAGGAVVVTLGESRFSPSRIGEATQDANTSLHVVMRMALSRTATVELVEKLGKLIEATSTTRGQVTTPERQALKPH